ncbi:MAG: acireductone synthase [Bacteroidia bacterium]|nr:acireductone synthase [Bacteroidia bacterium]MDW8157406.1 acireductone synthase [Bacteroidia bacterium]
MIRFLLLDIEGTTSSISFVKEVLFPYSKSRLKEFTIKHSQEERIIECIQETQTILQQENMRDYSLEEIINKLLEWIEADKKITPLKKLQGYIWEEGFTKGVLKAHVYEDVPFMLEQWKYMGIRMGIYSSGSVFAQKLFFKYSTYGDLTPYFEAYFDTEVGNKKESGSYEKILATLQLEPEEIMFLSDNEQELDAAAAVGYHTTQILRIGTRPSNKHLQAKSFFDVYISQ